MLRMMGCWKAERNFLYCMLLYLEHDVRFEYGVAADETRNGLERIMNGSSIKIVKAGSMSVCTRTLCSTYHTLDLPRTPLEPTRSSSNVWLSSTSLSSRISNSFPALNLLAGS